MTDVDTDVVVVGAGLAGLVATVELAAAGRRVTVVDQEPEASLGGQAWWSFGGLFLVDSPEQRRLGVRDSAALALRDWMGSAAFDRASDHWPRRWAEAYVDFAAGEKRSWLRGMGVRFFPVVGWAERGDGTGRGHGNSVPRFHIVWGTGPGLLEPFLRRLHEHVDAGRVRLLLRHRVEALVLTGGRVTGVRGSRLVPSGVTRGEASPREVVGDFELAADAVLVTSGGIGGDLELVRRSWPDRLGGPPQRLVAGVPASVDGRMLTAATAAGASLINPDRMWHYTEGLQNHDPVWPDHGIRILPGPSSLWVDGAGRRLPA
uniref:FAD-binding dehydrogenase n=1 Tax=Desertihabitans aurantiacus TaxID=2282477 RepID=UPI000DF7BEF9